jgi:hypothetical protein
VVAATSDPVLAYATAILERFAILFLRMVSILGFQPVVFWISGSEVVGG